MHLPTLHNAYPFILLSVFEKRTYIRVCINVSKKKKRENTQTGIEDMLLLYKQNRTFLIKRVNLSYNRLF